MSVQAPSIPRAATAHPAGRRGQVGASRTRPVRSAGRHAARRHEEETGPVAGIAGHPLVARVRGTLRYRIGRQQAHVVLAAWATAWFLLMARHGGVSWHYFVQGGDGLLDFHQAGGGLHLYASNPQLQMGPLAFLVSGLLVMVGPGFGLLVAQLTLALSGLLVFLVACRLGDEVRPSRVAADAGRRLLLAGLAFIPVWMNLAVRFVHVDDVLALVLVTLALRAVRHRQGLLAGLLLGLSVDAKPWALPFLALLFALPAGRRRAPMAAAAGALLVAWLPFLLADPASLMAARFTIANSAASTLRTLGVTAPVTPWWDRPAQAGLGLVLALVAVRRGRWAAVVLLATGARVVLDPGSYTYYAAGLAVGALLWDQVGTRRALPVWTWSCASVLFASRWLPLPPSVHGWTRLVFFLLCVGFLALRPARRHADAADPCRQPADPYRQPADPYPLPADPYPLQIRADDVAVEPYPTGQQPYPWPDAAARPADDGFPSGPLVYWLDDSQPLRLPSATASVV
jgi:hypothetical protein